MYRAKPKIQPPLYSDLPPTGPEIEKAKSLMRDSRTAGTPVSRRPGTRGLSALASLARGMRSNGRL